MGSSIIKNAFIKARQRPGGVSLGLQRLGVNIWWQGRSGLILSKIRQQMNVMMRLEDPPDFIIIHIGGNDIGNIPVGYLQLQLKQFLNWVSEKLPHASLVFSQILPRSKWRYSKNNEKMEKCRLRLNSTVAAFLINKGGYYIHYPDIKPTTTFLEDGVHLTDLGSEVFLNIIQGAIEAFTTGVGGKSFPH